MFRPSILAIFVVAAALPALALAAPVTTPVPVAGTFETVESRGDFDVQVREGSPASVEIVAEPGMAESIRVELSGSALRLSRVTSFDSTKGVVVKVVLPEFRGLSVGGSGKGTAESGPAPRDVKLAVSGSGHLAWKGTAAALALAVSGSGDLSSQGDTGEASVQVSGSGDARLSGKGDSLKVAVSGSGSVDAKAFAAKDASVSIAGSGDVSLRLAGGTLTARVSGSGSVTWSGEGKLGDVEVTGSGRFRKR
jgi:hypothetical protein